MEKSCNDMCKWLIIAKRKIRGKRTQIRPIFQIISLNKREQTWTLTIVHHHSHRQVGVLFTHHMYTQTHPHQNMPYSQAYGQPYYGSPPPPPVPMPLSQVPISQLPPLPVSPPVSASQGQSQNVLSGDVVAQLFQRLDMMDQKLGQLQSIQSTLQNVTVQVNEVSTRLKTVESKVGDIERSREFDSKMLDDIKGRQREMDKSLKSLQKAEEEQKMRLIDLQSRQMRDNLIFHNIRDERDEDLELCYKKLADMMQDDMKIEDARSIRFDRVHRLGKYDASKTRPIIAKFCFFQERERVRKSAKNLEGTQYSVSQQFPKEIQARRKELVPTLKKLKNEGQNAYLSVDKLYVDGALYRGELVAGEQQQNRGNPGNTNSHGLGRGRGRGRGGGDFGQRYGWGQGQDHGLGNMRGGVNNQGQGFVHANQFDVLQNYDHEGQGQGHMDIEAGQGQGQEDGNDGEGHMGAVGGHG